VKTVPARAAFAWVQARLQARHGDAPRAADWLELEASRSTGQFLAVARAGTLAPWVQGIEASFDAPHVEQMLRERWAAYVEQVARWMPTPWRASTRWFGVLPQLPLIDAVRRGEAGRELPIDDPRFDGFAHLDRGAEGAGTAAVWRTEWQRRTPIGEFHGEVLQRPAQLLLPALFDAHGGRAAQDESVRHALIRLFRRFAFSPVAVFAHLALVALDVERVRGGLLVRRLLPAASQAEVG
jgi:hypothetical protein